MKPLNAGKDIDKNNEILMRKKTLLQYFKSYIDNHQKPPTKHYLSKRNKNFVQLLSIPDISAELQTADNDYIALSISKDDDF